MIAPDVKQWIGNQVHASQYANPGPVINDVVQVLETHTELRPRTEFADNNEIWSVLYVPEQPTNVVVKVPRAYPWQPPQVFVHGNRQEIQQQTSLMDAVQTHKQAAPQLPNKPPVPSKQPPLPVKPTSNRATLEPRDMPQRPPKVPDLPSKLDLPSKYAKAPPLPPTAPGSPYASHPSSAHASLPGSRPPSVYSQNPQGPVKSIGTSITISDSRPITPNVPLKPPVTPQPQPQPPIDLMNSASLASTPSLSSARQSERQAVLQQLSAKLSALPDPPEYAEIKRDAQTLARIQTEIKQKQQAIAKRKQQSLANIEMLTKAAGDANKIIELVDSQLVPSQLPDLVQVADPDASALQSRARATQETLDLSPRASDAGSMDSNAYSPLVRQSAREQFHQKLRSTHKI